ncbi:twin-arginine translocase subunit TatC [Bacillus sp. MRMR6]|uniref:twin-arginine translocase subunit TatC n=1 Tax=Bacillus sp. MRMR6 TaxID=1928617 RepID=UPI0009511351|nr:twin-arginine translocase subunit TatC [Bacillus sp. MRMR6]OLS40943.1 twin arginine-targeting protein translocase TatC [Bacillus sp. MRMR6]
MDSKELFLTDHMDDLRKRLIITAAAFCIFFLLGFIYVEDIYQWFVRNLEFKLIVLGPSDIIWIYVMLAGLIALIGTIPVLSLEIWLFIKPGLKPKERKYALMYVPALFILFILGLAFGYFVILPTIFDFLVGLSGDLVLIHFTVEKYFQFIMNITLPFGFLFELPVVVLFLTSLGIVNPNILKKMRKYAYFVLGIIATVISPPDFLSEILVLIPLLFLYEISIILSKLVFRKNAVKAKEAELRG